MPKRQGNTDRERIAALDEQVAQITTQFSALSQVNHDVMRALADIRAHIGASLSLVSPAPQVPATVIPLPFQLPMVLIGNAPIVQAADGAIVATMDAVLKTKIERFIRGNLANPNLANPTPKQLRDYVKGKLTPEEKKLLGGGQDADVNAAIENALRNMEKAGHIKFIPGDARNPSVWVLTEEGKKLDEKYAND